MAKLEELLKEEQPDVYKDLTLTSSPDKIKNFFVWLESLLDPICDFIRQ